MNQSPIEWKTEKTRDGYRVTGRQIEHNGPRVSVSIPYPVIILVVIGVALFLWRHVAGKNEPISMICCNEIAMYYSLPGGCRKVYFSRAEASSENTVILDRYTYEPGKAIDGDFESSWQEGDYGDGRNEWIKLSFESPETIRYIVLKLGNWRENYPGDTIPYARYVENNTPTELALIINNSDTEYIVSFSSVRENHYIIFDEPCSIESILFLIKSVEHGTVSNDACISDISAYG